MRIVLDTTVLVSGLLFPGGTPSRIVRAWRNGALSLWMSDHLWQELERTLEKLSARTRLGGEELAEFLELMRFQTEAARVDAHALARADEAGLRDPCDVPVLATLIGSGADFLVSGDKDLLVLADRFPILSPAEFCARFGL